MNELQIFQNSEFGEIRTITKDNEVLFCLGDLCRALELTAKGVKQRLSDEVISNYPIADSLGRMQNTLFVNEDGMYDTILESRKDSARKFRKWVTGEVLPSIRKTGSYQIQNLSTEMKAILMHDEKIVKIENRMDKLEFDIPLYGSEADELSKHVKRKGVAILGGKQSEAYKDKKIRDKVYKDIYNEIKREFDVYDDDGKTISYKALKRKYLTDAHKMIDSYAAPYVLAETIANANAQMQLRV